jgi:hypothetical protein
VTLLRTADGRIVTTFSTPDGKYRDNYKKTKENVRRRQSEPPPRFKYDVDQENIGLYSHSHSKVPKEKKSSEKNKQKRRSTGGTDNVKIETKIIKISLWPGVLDTTVCDKVLENKNKYRVSVLQLF